MKALAVGAAVVLLALVGIYLALHGDDAVRRDAPVARDATLEDPGASQPMPRAGDAAPEAAEPRLADEQAGKSDRGPHRRDHRSAPSDDALAAPVHVPGARTIAPDVTAALAQLLRRALATCTTAPLRVDATLTIAIHAHQVTITEARLAPRDAASTVDESCLRANALGVSTRADQESDLEHYAITMSLVLQ